MGTKKAGEINGSDVYVDVDDVVIKKTDLEKYKQYEKAVLAWQDDNHVPVHNDWYQKMLLIDFDKNTPIADTLLKELSEKATAYDTLDLENNVPVNREQFAKLLGDSANLQSLDLENSVLIDKEKMSQLSALLSEYHTDIKALVKVFSSFADLFTGNFSVMSLPGIIGKIMKDDRQKAELSGIVQIIDKYTDKTAKLNG